MNTWAVNENNDIEIKNGQINIVRNLDALRARIDAALQTVKGEVDDDQLGVDYFGIIFSDTPISMKVQEISRVISAVNGVERVEFNGANADKIKQTLSFYFTIYSVYGQFVYDSLLEMPAQ